MKFPLKYWNFYNLNLTICLGVPYLGDGFLFFFAPLAFKYEWIFNRMASEFQLQPDIIKEKWCNLSPIG
jgi:hypothetical protein